MKKISNKEINLMILSGDLKNQEDWDRLILNYKLTEEQLNKYADKLNWKYVTIFQNLSDCSTTKYKNKIVWNEAWNNPNFTLKKRYKFYKYNLRSNLLEGFMFIFAIIIIIFCIFFVIYNFYFLNIIFSEGR